jgi:hypothetical protein
MDGPSLMLQSMMKLAGLKPEMLEQLSTGLFHDLKMLTQQNQAILNNQRHILTALGKAEYYDDGNRGGGTVIPGSPLVRDGRGNAIG